MNSPTDQGPVSSRPEASKPPKKGFIGLFAGLELPNLIQMMAMNGFTGKVELRCGSRSGEIYLKRGDIVHAQLEETTGATAFEELLGWVEGEVLLEAERRPEVETIDVPWHALLIQAMARIEDREAKAGDAQEPTPVKSQPQASEILRLRGFHRMLLDRPGVTNCLVGKAAELLCPAQPVAKLLQWYRIMWEVLETSCRMTPPDAGGQPVMISLVLENRNWLLLRLGDFTVGVELARGSDLAEIHRDMVRLWEQG